MGELQYAIAVLALLVVANAWLFRRFRRADKQISSLYHMTAAIAVSLGALTVLTGIGHSAAVVALALREPDYGALQVLRLTTGSLLLYSGAMGVALSRAISLGQQLAIAVAAGSASLFVVYLLIILPIGGAETVPPMLVLWSIYLFALALTATIAVRPRAVQVRPIG